jgi:hypothetical protein
MIWRAKSDSARIGAFALVPVVSLVFAQFVALGGVTVAQQANEQERAGLTASAANSLRWNVMRAG